MKFMSITCKVPIKEPNTLKITIEKQKPITVQGSRHIPEIGLCHLQKQESALLVLVLFHFLPRLP